MRQRIPSQRAGKERIDNLFQLHCDIIFTMEMALPENRVEYLGGEDMLYQHLLNIKSGNIRIDTFPTKSPKICSCLMKFWICFDLFGDYAAQRRDNAWDVLFKFFDSFFVPIQFPGIAIDSLFWHTMNKIHAALPLPCDPQYPQS